MAGRRPALAFQALHGLTSSLGAATAAAAGGSAVKGAKHQQLHAAAMAPHMLQQHITAQNPMANGRSNP
jgi:hypothetical protein